METNKEKLVVGNAYTEQTRGWFVGRFMDPEMGLLHDNNVEVKWADIKAGEKEDSLVIAVRWPSVKGEEIEVEKY